MAREKKDIFEKVDMSGVEELAEGYPVQLVTYKDGGCFIGATNEGGYNGTEVNLKQLLLWVKTHRPDLLEGI